MKIVRTLFEIFSQYLKIHSSHFKDSGSFRGLCPCYSFRGFAHGLHLGGKMVYSLHTVYATRGPKNIFPKSKRLIVFNSISRFVKSS